MQRPLQGYFSSTTRAALADTADTALRRIGRDVRLALPNTVRVGGSGLFVELIPIKTGGRYQQNDACFSTGCSSLSTLGDMLTNVQVTTGRTWSRFTISTTTTAPTVHPPRRGSTARTAARGSAS